MQQSYGLHDGNRDRYLGLVYPWLCFLQQGVPVELSTRMELRRDASLNPIGGPCHGHFLAGN